MRLDDRLYRAFLEEMHELEAFRMAYAAAHPSVPLERDDPDVKRLMEALAFFAARTRVASLRSIAAMHRRLFQQFLPYLLSPLPAAGMVQAVPSGQFSEPVLFPRGSELLITPEGGKGALFRTLEELRIFPISLGRVETLIRGRGGFRVVLPFSVPYPRNDEVGELKIYINYLDDYQASLRVIEELRAQLARASVCFEERVDDETRGTACEVSFESHSNQDLDEHPLARERLFFHFPRRELFLTLKLPPPPRNWSRFFLCLDLGPRWPRTLRLNRDVFQLFVVPVQNLQRTMAAPVVCDGTKDRYPIRHPAGDAGFSLCSVRGVYKVERGAMIPLVAGTLSSGSGTYEISEEVASDGSQRHSIALHLPESFEEPRTISIDALWLQRWFSAATRQKLVAVPYRRNIPGVRWEIQGEMAPHRESGFGENMDFFLHLFVLQNKRTLSQEDIDILLHTLGSVWNGPFAEVRDLLREVRVEEVPIKGDGAGTTLKLVYHLGVEDAEQPLMRSFVRHLQQILDAWISDAVLEVRLEARERKVDG